VALQVRDLAEARRFYGEMLGCAEGRSAADWVDFDLYGHQFVCHLNPALGPNGRIAAHFNPVDGHGVPVPHCGVALEPPSGNPRRPIAAAARRVGHRAVCVLRIAGRAVHAFVLDPSGMRRVQSLRWI
jgi:extradiol dioxygenase family protein